MTRPIWDACTQCQRDVIVVLARTGWSNKRIARHLNLTEMMVKSRLRRIYDKLKIRRRALLVTAYMWECQQHWKDQA